MMRRAMVLFLALLLLQPAAVQSQADCAVRGEECKPSPNGYIFVWSLAILFLFVCLFISSPILMDRPNAKRLAEEYETGTYGVQAELKSRFTRDRKISSEQGTGKQTDYCLVVEYQASFDIEEGKTPSTVEKELKVPKQEYDQAIRDQRIKLHVLVGYPRSGITTSQRKHIETNPSNWKGLACFFGVWTGFPFVLALAISPSNLHRYLFLFGYLLIIPTYWFLFKWRHFEDPYESFRRSEVEVGIRRMHKQPDNTREDIPSLDLTASETSASS